MEASRLTATDLRARASRGFAWKTFGLVAAQPITLLTTVVLARLLTPSDFGVAAMVAVFMSLVTVVNEFGLTSAVVQRQALTEDELQSVFWFNMLVGFVLLFVGVASSTLLAAVFDEPLLAQVVPVASLTFVISSLALIPSALFARHMDFRRPAVGEVWTAVVTLLASTVFALLGWGVWAIVCGGLVRTVSTTLYLLLASGWRPRAHARWHEARPFVRFGGVLTVASVLAWCSWNVDNLLVGRLLGPSPLGAYSLSFQLTSAPTYRLSSTVVTTFLPAFSLVPDERARFRKAYLEGMAFVALPSAVVLAIMAVLSEEVVLGLYGPKWSAAVTPLRILCLAGFVLAVTALTGLVFRGLGLPSRELRWSVVNLAAVTIGVLAGIQAGISGVALGVTLGMVVSRAAVQMAAARILDISVGELWRALLPAVLAGTTAAALAGGVKLTLVELGVPPLARLLVAGTVAVAGAWLVIRSTRFGAPARDMEGLARGVFRMWREQRGHTAPREGDDGTATGG